MVYLIAGKFDFEIIHRRIVRNKKIPRELFLEVKVKKKFNKVYQFKISLKEIKPPIWRRIQVPDTYSFWDLHVAIQDSMGWRRL